MRIGLVERLAEQTMVHKRVTRNAALARHGWLWGLLGAGMIAVGAFAPLETLSLNQRGAEVPYEFLMCACGGMLLVLAVLFWMSREPD